MKKITLGIIVVVIATISAQSQDFRKATWGMSPSQVKAAESSKPMQEEADLLVYEVELAGYDAYAGYVFAKGKLTRAKYIIAVEHMNANDYISEYEMLNTLLNKKYGKPIEDVVDWKSRSHATNDKSDWAYEIRMGRLVLYSIYRTSTTEIQIVLNSENYQLVNSIAYESLNEELQKLEEEKVLEDF